MKRQWLSALAIGSLMLIGGIAANPLTSGAQQSATPTVSEHSQSDATPVVGTPLLQPSIDFTRAQQIALEGQTGAAVTEVGLDGQDGVLAYDISLDNGTDIRIDATTGAVIATEQAESNDEDNVGDNNGENAQDDDGKHDEGNNDQNDENDGGNEGND